MKIVDMKVRTVAIPTTCQLRHNTGVHPGYFIRNVLELVTDEGSSAWARWAAATSAAH